MHLFLAPVFAKDSRAESSFTSACLVRALHYWSRLLIPAPRPHLYVSRCFFTPLLVSSCLKSQKRNSPSKLLTASKWQRFEVQPLNGDLTIAIFDYRIWHQIHWSRIILYTLTFTINPTYFTLNLIQSFCSRNTFVTGCILPDSLVFLSFYLYIIFVNLDIF